METTQNETTTTGRFSQGPARDGLFFVGGMVALAAGRLVTRKVQGFFAVRAAKPEAEQEAAPAAKAGKKGGAAAEPTA